ncbi:helix-turn-helix domain-containing protein [Bradyrhizobium sp.]|uniref:helix-turn-helix domain-containing protein n=1 Tax=Bradyrhizobium sp. TaxID=376 RepID=UPI0025B8C04A|nr:helix-turn-helix domain-containing protein [Bradyrhizobium sp.]
MRHNFELAYSSGDFHAWLRRRAPKARRYGSVCTGACFLGAAGLLHGLNATTHWQHATEIAERFPAAKVVPDQIYVKDGSLYTGAGVTAGIDLALKLIEDDHGHDLALMVARRLVVFLKRPGGQSQFSAHLAAQIANEGRITGSPARKVLLMVLANYADESGVCWPSQETLARGTEQSVDTVQRQLKKLQNLGVIERERMPKRRGQWQGYRYKLSLRSEHENPPRSRAEKRGPDPVCVTGANPDLRPGRAATSTPPGPQSLRLKPSLEPSFEPSHSNMTTAASERLRAFQRKQEGSEVVQNRIALRIGDDGWLILGGMSDAQRAYLTTLERQGRLDDATLASAAFAIRRAQPP